jgi:hypothetical protein
MGNEGTGKLANKLRLNTRGGFTEGNRKPREGKRQANVWNLSRINDSASRVVQRLLLRALATARAYKTRHK